MTAVDPAHMPFPEKKAVPRCPVFGICGGCQFQDIHYNDELDFKERRLKELFRDSFPGHPFPFDPITASPLEYHYRNRLDMKLLKAKTGEVFIGFSPVPGSPFRQVVPVEECPIAMESVSDFIPRLKKDAVEKLPPKYRIASLVVKCGGDGRVLWGGIGRRSLRTEQADYLWADINGRRIHFSLEVFFQANVSILPRVISKINETGVLNEDTHFYDIYGGVGLFSVALSGRFRQATLIEENKHAVKLAEYNAAYNRIENFSAVTAKAEEYLPELFSIPAGPENRVVMVDPPRDGLKPDAAFGLCRYRAGIKALLYLSCGPESMARDLKIFLDQGWTVEKIMPFDFFPRTKHIETLVWLR